MLPKADGGVFEPETHRPRPWIWEGVTSRPSRRASDPFQSAPISDTIAGQLPSAPQVDMTHCCSISTGFLVSEGPALYHGERLTCEVAGDPVSSGDFGAKARRSWLSL